MGAVELPNEDPDVFEHFLEFLYTGTYDDGWGLGVDQPADASMLDPEEVLDELD